MAKVGSWGVSAKSSWPQRRSLTFQKRLAACLAKVVRCTHPSLREEVGGVASEVGEELRIFVEPQELADHLDGEDFGVAELWGGSAPSEAPEVSGTVVDEAEDGDDEGAKIQKKTSATFLWCYWSTPSVHGGLLRCSGLQRNVHTGLAKEEAAQEEAKWLIEGAR